MKSDISIVLVDGRRRLQIVAPPDFNWDKYPERVVSGGKNFAYIGTVDGTPHYKLEEV